MFEYMHTCVIMIMHSGKAEEDIYLLAGEAGVCQLTLLLCGCWDPNSGPQIAQKELLTSEPAFLSPHFPVYMFLRQRLYVTLVGMDYTM